ncbi:hypothetical protein D3H65_28060 [Paraflavitalea soli]|uniref:Uncharacterized protein n=1 Tax=Paraflavitalea soli TaxID=2315862 RepID=A0A3B7MSW6_9BACT|nr:hypothetical protein [Paraflavitalea soli]AXY77602.1 hypothetical protein D3H65_28060 [Paraflavitalea soli]
MGKVVLSKKEFAINEGAKIVFDASKTKIKIKKDGTVSITINGKLSNTTTDLQVGTVDNDPIKFDSCGVFNMDSTENFKDGKVKDIFLTLVPNPAPADPDIVLKSSSNDIVAKTDGEKGNHGSNFLSQPTPLRKSAPKKSALYAAPKKGKAKAKK